MEKFTKEMLRTGMRVEQRCGDRFIILKETETFDILLVNDYCWAMFENKINDLTSNVNECYDVIKIFKQPHKMTDILDINKTGSLLWERQKPKEMTVAEIELALGYPVKIAEQRTKSKLEQFIKIEADKLIKANIEFAEALKEFAKEGV